MLAKIKNEASGSQESQSHPSQSSFDKEDGRSTKRQHSGARGHIYEEVPGPFGQENYMYRADDQRLRGVTPHINPDGASSHTPCQLPQPHDQYEATHQQDKFADHNYANLGDLLIQPHSKHHHQSHGAAVDHRISLQSDQQPAAMQPPLISPLAKVAASTVAHATPDSDVMPTPNLGVGSRIQISPNIPNEPYKYGVIRWIGELPRIQGLVAGTEMDYQMSGGTDGTFLAEQQKFFNCPPGRGVYLPLTSLQPDTRFMDSDIVMESIRDNPLEDVTHEEFHDQLINPGQIFKYIGERRGIQGHQNSSYLDSTVFGLFAVSDVFDSIFLEQDQGDPARGEVKHLLWKGIVNPLRKNGVVRYESVMRLRNKLEEVGKVKGIHQDEQDPEEFLNMLFKHTLHIPPFLNIERPVGVEQEYFVQLLPAEADESLKLSTVGDLLSIMYKEQKISFTKVPSKLLIQIPRYGREFKTYQKIIPGLKLDLKGLLSSKYHCFICGNAARKKCSECFTTNDTTMYYCEGCAQLAHGKATKRDQHDVKDMAADDGGFDELDLLSVICIETSHYVCFTRSEERWVFFDSMANRVKDKYNIPKIVDCTDVLNEWVYPANKDLTRLLNTPSRDLPEFVRRFTQDIYLCIYIQPDFAVYGDFEDNLSIGEAENDGKEERKFGVDHATIQEELDDLKLKHATLQRERKEKSIQFAKLQRDCSQLKITHQELVEKEKNEQVRYQQELEQAQSRHQQEIQQIRGRHQVELQEMSTQKQSMEERLHFQERRIQELERKLETANAEVKEVRFTQLLKSKGADSSWSIPRNEVIIREEIGRGASGLVSKGQFRGQDVAVKQIHQFILTQKHVVNAFKREVRIMASVQHPNLVRFIGAVIDDSVENVTATPLLVLELLHINLRKAYEDQSSSLGASVMLSIFRDMAYGLHHLHEHQEPIIHRDVSAPNILLEALPGGMWRAKLSDFGSANFLKRSSTLGVGAIVCTAPEMFPRDDPSAPVPRPTVKCDVFSYGIVLVEVITKTMPSLENRHQLFQKVERKWRMMHDLVTQCTQRRPEDRPMMSVILNRLNRFPVAQPR